MPAIALSRIDVSDAGGLTRVGPIPHLPHAGAPSHLWERSRGVVHAHAAAITCPAMLAGSVQVEATFAIPLPPLASSVYVKADTKLVDLSLGPRQIPAGAAGPHTLTWSPDLTRQAAKGVERIDWTWSWSVSQDGVTWTRLEDTHHTAFALLDLPATPWALPGSSPATPWFGILDLACDWAGNAVNAREVRDQMAYGLFALGGKPIVKKYKTTNIEYVPGVMSHFVSRRRFVSEEFLDLARQRSSSFYWSFNCLDGAVAVAALCAAVGCETGFVKLCPPAGSVEFRTHMVRGAGLAAFSQHDFEYHAVTAVPARGAATDVWDGCLILDLDAAPGVQPPHTHGLALGLASGAAGFDMHLTPLAVRTSQSQPISVHGSAAAAMAIPTCDASIKRLGEVFRGVPWTEASEASGVVDALLERLQRIAFSFESGVVPIGDTFFDRLRASVVLPTAPQHIVAFEGWQAPTRRKALWLLADMIDRCATPLVHVPGVGDVALRPKTGPGLLVLYGRYVAYVEWAPHEESILQELHGLLF